MANSPHPDANLWSVYLDHGLGWRQRRFLFRHLAHCPECRCVCAALATMLSPALPTQHQLARRLPSRAWSWLTLGWDAPLALAAGVLLIAAAAFWQQRAPSTIFAPPAPATSISTSETTAARTNLRGSAALALTASLRPPRTLSAHLAPAPVPGNFEPLAAPPLPILAANLPMPSVRTAVQPALDFTPLMTGFQDQPIQSAAPFELVAWNGSMNGVTAPQRVAATTASSAQDTALLLPASNPQPEAALALPAFASGFTGNNLPVTASLARGPLAPSLTPGLGWAISHGGQLLRSLGAGIWEAVPLVPGLRLCALANLGGIVWAAARTDQIFTSSDNGAHWHQISLPALASNAAQPALVRSITLTGASHVAIVAADGHIWITSDGGTSWTLQ